MLETKRLLIRPFTENDIPGYAKLSSDPEVMKYIRDGSTLDYDQSREYILNYIEFFKNHGWSRYAVLIKETDDFIGFCGFSDFNNELDFGWRYSQSSWGNGFGTEAAKAVLDYGLDVLKFKRIVSVAYRENIASIKIMDKIGMTFEQNILLNDRETVQYVKEVSTNNLSSSNGG